MQTADPIKDRVPAFLADIASQYRKHQGDKHMATAQPMPEVLPLEALPEVNIDAMPAAVGEFLTTGVSDDRSKAVYLLALALRDAGLTEAQRLAWMFHHPEVWDYATSKRQRSTDADTDAAALAYLWEHYARKVGPVVDIASMFEDRSEDKVESARDAFLSPITLDELENARTSPRVLVRDFLYACVRSRVASGGTGKTTLALFEAAMLALGRDLWGYTPAAPARTVFVTREDDRELLVGRVREIMKAMHLTDADRAAVLERVRIVDLTGQPFRLSAIKNDVVTPDTKAIDWLLAMLQVFRPDWVIFDPVVSFGVGESRVNDAEQGLIEAARIIKKRLDCCVELIHHTGKANAREKALDQYAGRGGSALSDGSRMVAVLQPLDASEWHKATGTTLTGGESGLVMALPKLSYAPQQGPIYIRRNGYAFHHQQATPRTPTQVANDRARTLWDFVKAEYDKGIHHTGKSLDACTEQVGMSRQHLRDALTNLKTQGRIVWEGKPTAPGAYLMPLTIAEDPGESHPDLAIGEED